MAVERQAECYFVDSPALAAFAMLSILPGTLFWWTVPVRNLWLAPVLAACRPWFST